MEKRDISIHIEHLTRVEGHGNIVINISNGNIEKCEWQVTEAPRFFEGMVRGRYFNEMHHIVSRICGICSIAHQVASLRATEAAMGISVSTQTVRLRKLALHAENMQSHLLHIGYLVLPDLLGLGSILPLAQTNKEELLLVIGLHRLANEMSDLIAGRTTHPQRLILGDFAKYPKEGELIILKERLKQSLPMFEKLAHLFKSLWAKIPPFERETEYIALNI